MCDCVWLALCLAVSENVGHVVPHCDTPLAIWTSGGVVNRLSSPRNAGQEVWHLWCIHYAVWIWSLEIGAKPKLALYQHLSWRGSMLMLLMNNEMKSWQLTGNVSVISSACKSIKRLSISLMEDGRLCLNYDSRESKMLWHARLSRDWLVWARSLQFRLRFRSRTPGTMFSIYLFLNFEFTL